MKRFIVLLMIATMFLLTFATVFADPAPEDDQTNCVLPLVPEVSSDSSLNEIIVCNPEFLWYH